MTYKNSVSVVTEEAILALTLFPSTLKKTLFCPTVGVASSVAVRVAVKTLLPDLEVRAPLETLTSLETSLARTVTPKTAARQATVRTDPTTTATFMLLTEPSTLDNCPLRLDMVDLLSASIFGFGFGFVFVFFVFVRERVRKSEEVPRMKHSLYPTHRRKIERVKGSMDVILRQFINFPFPLPLFSANFFNSKTISLSLSLFNISIVSH